MKITIVAGNPKADSRTLAAARVVGSAFGPVSAEIDVIGLGAGLLGWGDSAVAEAVASVRASELVVFASPTFKATYSGVLKLFLDQFDTGTGLAGVTAIPLMLGAGPTHLLAPDLLLKPVLVELGATTPTQGLYLNEKTFAEPGSLEPWLARWRASVVASVAGLRAAPSASRDGAAAG